MPQVSRPLAKRAVENPAPPPGSDMQSRFVRSFADRVRGLRLSGGIQSWGPTAALLLLCVVFSILSPRFRTIENLQNVGDAASILMVVSVGLTFVLLMGAIDLSVEGVIAATALTTALTAANTRNENDFGLFAVVFAIAAGAGFGLFNGLANTRLRVPSFMATLGMSSIGLGVATVLYGGQSPAIMDMAIGSWALDKWLGFSRLTFVAVAVAGAGYLIQRYTRLGRYAYVIGGGEDVARLSGIKIDRYKVLLFMLAGGLFGLAGAMCAARLEAGVVDAGAGMQFAGITAVVIGGTLLSGGRGGVLHTIVGVLILTVLQDGMVLVGVSPYVLTALQAILIVAAVVATGWPLRRRMRVIK